MSPASLPPSRYAGILNLDKPAGLTSHDVVDRVRRVARTRQVGHAGTLDPAASGVLLVCLGAATRASEYLMDGTKRYRGVVRFGATSNTDDAAGIVTPTGRAVDLDETRLREVLAGFLGEIQQVPPAFAAIKLGGQPAYKSARSGVHVDLAPRAVRIDAIDVVDWSPPDLTVEITCSKGTYIRALARDVGQALGTGGYLRALVRLASGRFNLDDAVTLDEVARAGEAGYLDRLLHPPDTALIDWPAVLLDPADVARIRQGRAWTGPSGQPDQLARAYDREAGTLVAILRCQGASGEWQPAKVFPEGPDDGRR